MDKKQLRKTLIEKRKNISKDKKALYDKEISHKIIESDFFKNSGQVLVFSSTEDEFDTNLIVKSCRKEGKAVFYPICLDKTGNMQFRRVDSPDDLQIGMYNISEPEAHCEEYKQKHNDLVIVPALSVDKNHCRIGYGKGYYDRFLKKFNGVSVCPCYSEMCEDELPTDEYDIKVNIIVTEKEVLL